MATGLSNLLIAAPVVLSCGMIGSASIYAQVATDGTAGPRVRLGGNFEVGAELGTRAGRNLFHSFERFSLATGERATFTGPDDIRNVISRVTGGARSDIDGTIASTIPGADFYFLNPAGIAFGPNARLDLQGSFHVSTADELRFADGAKFSAASPTASSFTVAAPEAFGFLRAEPRPFLVDRSVLEVPIGQALSIVGGDIDIVGGPLGFIRAEAGRITLAALGSPGFAAVADGGITATAFADIHLTDQALVDVRGNGGGAVRIDSSAFVLDRQSFVRADNTGALDAEGGISVDADRITITGGGEISSSTFAEGDAGTVVVAGPDLHGPGIAGGAQHLTARELEIRDGGVISSGTEAKGSGGTVTIKAERLVVSGDGANDLTGITSQAAPGSTGKAGTVKVRAGELEIRDGGEISSGTFGSGNAGTVTVQAERLHIVGEGDSEFSTGIGTSAGFSTGPNGEVLLSTGNAGAVKVRAGELEIRDGGEIDSNTFGSGNAGPVTVKAERRLHIVGGSASDFSTGISSSAASTVTQDVVGQGNAGAVNVIVTAGDLEIRDNGEISSAASGGGDAGKVTVEADRLALDRAAITTFSASAGGGEIQLLVGDVIDLHDSAITTSVVGGNDPTAGNIRIDPTVLIIDGSRIQANAPAGFGGRVTIVADNILVPGGDFDALLERRDISATGGDPTRAGTIAVNAPEVDLSGGLVVLEGALLDAASQLRARCGARRDIGASSFTGVGRGGLPPSPDGPLASAYVVDEAAVAEAQKAGSRRTAGTAPTNVRCTPPNCAARTGRPPRSRHSPDRPGDLQAAVVEGREGPLIQGVRAEVGVGSASLVVGRTEGSAGAKQRGRCQRKSRAHDLHSRRGRLLR